MLADVLGLMTKIFMPSAPYTVSLRGCASVAGELSENRSRARNKPRPGLGSHPAIAPHDLTA